MPEQIATAVMTRLATETSGLVTQAATASVPICTPTPRVGKLTYVQGGDIWVRVVTRSGATASHLADRLAY